MSATPQPSAQPSRTTAAWTAERIRGLGTVTDVPTAAAIFGLSRSVAYDLVKRDAFPVPVLRFGTRYRIPVAPILTALHLGQMAGNDLTGDGNDASINPTQSAGHSTLAAPPPREEPVHG